jgi:hypothetical protein
MGKKQSTFIQGKLSRCEREKIHIHVGAVGKPHRGCHHNEKRALCVWERPA